MNYLHQVSIQGINGHLLHFILLPAYVYTDYKAQGRSLDSAIVDPGSARSLQGAYVMLSRVRTMDGLAILHPFRPNKIEEHISEEIREEFARLELEDRNTIRWYNYHLLRNA